MYPCYFLPSSSCSIKASETVMELLAPKPNPKMNPKKTIGYVKYLRMSWNNVSLQSTQEHGNAEPSKIFVLISFFIAQTMEKINMQQYHDHMCSILNIQELRL